MGNNTDKKTQLQTATHHSPSTHSHSSMAKRHRSPSKSLLEPYAHGELAVLPPPRLMPPRGWVVEEVPRSDGCRSDRYFYEPGSGKKFRSIKEVYRYINGEPNPFRSKSKTPMPFGKSRDSCRMMVSGGKLLRLDNEGSKNHLDEVRVAPSILPDGWIVEEVPRMLSNFADKYYYEPESGQKFRSLVAVEKYLADLNDDVPLSKTLEEIMENKPLARAFKLSKILEEIMENKPLAKAFKLETPKRKKKVTRESSQASSFLGPPMKVTWVIASAQGDSWNPFIAEALVPNSVKQQWANRLMLSMKEGTTNFQNSQA